MNIDAQIKNACSRLWTEIKSDSRFFLPCGALVAYFFLIDERLRAFGLTKAKDSWSSALFGDFMSLSAFGLIFIGLVLLGSVVTIAKSLGANAAWLAGLVSHVESRLAQISSSIIAFSFGVSAFALLHSAVTVTGDGLRVAVLMLVFPPVLFAGFVMASLIARREDPFDTWYGAVLTALVAIGMLAMFFHFGVK